MFLFAYEVGQLHCHYVNICDMTDMAVTRLYFTDSKWYTLRMFIFSRVPRKPVSQVSSLVDVTHVSSLYIGISHQWTYIN